VRGDLRAASAQFRLAAAAAAYGQLLRGGEYTGSFTYRDVITLAESADGVDAESRNFVQLAKLADGLTTQLPQARAD
jgi:Ca-activated chloride channel family protein